MNPKQIKELIALRMDHHMKGNRVRPLLITGPPGGGKTQSAEQAVHEMGVGYTYIHAPSLPSEDFGVPIPIDRTLEFIVPDGRFPFEGDDTWPEFGVIYVDELTQCDNPQQKVWANMMQARELHGRKLKPGWMFVCTGNRQEDRAGANRLLSHFNDRFTTVEYEVKTDDYIEWAYQHGNIREEVIAFLLWRPDLLMPTFDPNLPKNTTPRGWSEGVSVTLDCTPKAMLYEAIKGDIGEGPAVEFMAFLDIFQQVPDPDVIFAKPDSYHVPDEAHLLYAVIGALIARVEAKTFPAFITYVSRMEPAFMVMAMRNVITAKAELTSTKAFIDWAGGPGAKALFQR